MLADFLELLALEKAGHYKDALKSLVKQRESSKMSPVRKLNLRLLEERLHARLPSSTKKQTQEHRSWSAIITLWKRSDYFAEQLAAIRTQSIPPQEIIIVLNEGHISESLIREVGGDHLKIIHSDINSLYTRWAIAYIAEGEFVSIFDDDVIPGKYWIANAMRACISYNALVGPSGRIYNEKGRHGYFKNVDPVPVPKDEDTISCGSTDVYCDWVCNSYFFKREWVSHALNYVRYQDSFKTFDDIQLAISLFLSGGIQCVTPMQPPYEKKFHGSLKRMYGNDVHAIWKTCSGQHFFNRKIYIEQLIESGYVPVQQRDNLFRFHLIVPFGERQFLERCLLSIKGQDYQNFTCTLIDDCCDGTDALSLLQQLGLDEKHFRYVKTTKKAYPLRAREIATDILNANLADVIVHLDGDDWFSCPDALSRLNRAYRKGGILATYGNALSITNHKSRNFREYDTLKMSKRWNMSQGEPDATIVPFRRLGAAEISKGWGAGPWCAMHLRTFQFVKWLELNKKTFFDKSGNYLRCATDAAILIPILDTCQFESIAFLPDIACTYQRAGNNSFVKDPLHAQHVAEARAAVFKATASKNENLPNQHAICQALVGRSVPSGPIGANVIYDALDSGGRGTLKRTYLVSPPIKKCAIATIITPNHLADAILCLMSYKRNLRIECRTVVFVATDSDDDKSVCTEMLESSEIEVVFPSALQFTHSLSSALAEKYTLGSDEYRWGMKPVFLLELLRRGNELALFLDPDIYTVSDITDIHRKMACHPISVFPHFRDPDHTRLRGLLYKDGFFNGGMVAATLDGIPHLMRLYERCLKALAKDPSRQRWDDQKYFDLFILEVNNLFVNSDRGIDYSGWNVEPIEDLVAPSQRSVLLKSGFFVRLWHMASQMITDANDQEKTYRSSSAVYRPIIAIYYLTILYLIILLIVKMKNKLSDHGGDYIGLINRFKNIEKKIIFFAPNVNIDEVKQLLLSAQKGHENNFDVFLKEWIDSVLGSICFDNFEIFSLLLEDFFHDKEFVADFVRRIRAQDLRYVTDEVVCSILLSQKESAILLEEKSAGWLIKKQLQALQASGIKY